MENHEIAVPDIDLTRNKIYYNIGDSCYELRECECGVENPRCKDGGNCELCDFGGYEGKCPCEDCGIVCRGGYLKKRA